MIKKIFLVYNFCFFIFQAIVNEDASGDVLAMRMQIQELKVRVFCISLVGLLNY